MSECIWSDIYIYTLCVLVSCCFATKNFLNKSLLCFVKALKAVEELVFRHFISFSLRCECVCNGLKWLIWVCISVTRYKHTANMQCFPFCCAHTHTHLIFDSLNGFNWNGILRLCLYILTATVTVSLSIFKSKLNTNDKWDLKLCWTGGKPHKYHKTLTAKTPSSAQEFCWYKYTFFFFFFC